MLSLEVEVAIDGAGSVIWVLFLVPPLSVSLSLSLSLSSSSSLSLSLSLSDIIMAMEDSSARDDWKPSAW